MCHDCVVLLFIDFSSERGRSCCFFILFYIYTLVGGSWNSNSENNSQVENNLHVICRLKVTQTCCFVVCLLNLARWKKGGGVQMTVRMPQWHHQAAVGIQIQKITVCQLSLSLIKMQQDQWVFFSLFSPALYCNVLVDAAKCSYIHSIISVLQRIYVLFL